MYLKVNFASLQKLIIPDIFEKTTQRLIAKLDIILFGHSHVSPFTCRTAFQRFPSPLKAVEADFMGNSVVHSSTLMFSVTSLKFPMATQMKDKNYSF